MARPKFLLLATHPVLSGPAVERITKSAIDEVVVTDSVPLSAEARKIPKIKVLSVSELLARGIRNIHEETSISELFISTDTKEGRMEKFVVEGAARETRGKGPARRERRTGMIPAVLYGGKGDSIALSVNTKQLTRILRSESGHNTIFTVQSCRRTVENRPS